MFEYIGYGNRLCTTHIIIPSCNCVLTVEKGVVMLLVKSAPSVGETVPPLELLEDLVGETVPPLELLEDGGSPRSSKKQGVV